MILVYIDHDRGEVDPISLQAVSAAKALDADVQAVIVGPGAKDLAAGVAAFGATMVHVGHHPDLLDFTPRAHARALHHLVEMTSPRVLMGGGTPRGSEVLSHVAAMMDLPFASECVSITLTGPDSADIVRARWAGNLLDEAIVVAPILIATVQAHAFAALEAGAALSVSEFEVPVADGDLLVRVEDRVGSSAGGVGLAEAKVVVSGGRGMEGPEAFGMLEDVAGVLGGAVGCSRVVTSAGWRPHAEQVGQTGTKVAPELYLAFGISGATQHIAGCKSAKTLIAINTDSQAPIMGFADYVVVDNLHTFLPILIEKLKAVN
jgi:electron transfer flavoprotein alpha subunit